MQPTSQGPTSSDASPDDMPHGVLRRRDAGSVHEALHTTARPGGNECVLLLDGSRDTEDVHSVAQRLIDTLSRPHLINGIEVHISAGIGVVAGMHTASLANAVLQDASLAMQEATRAGGGFHLRFTPSIKDRATRRGIVSPIEFIEIAEECGLIEATVRVARSLGMSTTAEGVKTDGQAALLTTLGCDKGQGYLWSRPMTARAATQWLAAQSEAAGRLRRCRLRRVEGLGGYR